MPVYEYVCRDCKKKFSERKPVSQYRPRPACPKCKSRSTERWFSGVFVETSKKS